MSYYSELEKLTDGTVRYTAPENGIGVFKSVPKNIIVSPTCAIQMNDDTIVDLPLKKGDVVKSLFPIDLSTFIPEQEYLEHANTYKQKRGVRNMSYYASEEINDLEKENLKLKLKLEAIRTVIVDIFDKNTKEDDAHLYYDALIKIDKTIREYGL